MQISIKGFIYHKEAETFEDCFDRYGVNPATNKFCVSDGVSKSFFPGLWAEILVDSFLKTNGRVDIDSKNTIKSLQDDWQRKIIEIVNRPGQKYYVKNFFAQGRSAAATFVGLNFFKEDSKYKWESFALGDSFLFFVPGHSRNISKNFSNVVSLSSKKDFEFDNFPDYFDSRESVGRGKIRQIKHDLEEGIFYLMTDALSEWFIDNKQNAVDEIESWKSQDIYEKRIAELRKQGLQNDDSAILVIKVDDDNSESLNYSDISIFKLPHENLDFSIPDKPTEIEDSAISISQKFIQNDDEDKRAELLQRSVENKLQQELEIENMVEVFERKISEIDKKPKFKKKKKSLWKKITNFFYASDDIDDANEHPNEGNHSDNQTTDGNINSISDKF